MLVLPASVVALQHWTPGNLSMQAIQIKRKEQPTKDKSAGNGSEPARAVDIQQALAEKLAEEAQKAEYERKRQKVWPCPCLLQLHNNVLLPPPGDLIHRQLEC
jgi:hypothetical protein